MTNISAIPPGISILKVKANRFFKMYFNLSKVLHWQILQYVRLLQQDETGRENSICRTCSVCYMVEQL